MTIIHIITSTDVGGAETSLYRLISEFKKKEINQFVISLKRKGLIANKILSIGVPVYSLKNNFTTILKAFWYLRFKRNVIIQSWLYHADLFGSLISLIFRFKIIWNIRQTNFTNSDPVLTKTIMKLCVLLSYFIPSSIICVSYSALNQHKKFGYCKRKLRIISNGYLIENYNKTTDLCELRNLLSINRDNIVIGFVARYHPVKDYITFILLAEELLKINNKFIFLMVGNGFDLSNAQLLFLLKNKGILDAFRLVGLQNDTKNYYSLMDIFCLTSIEEGFPNVLVEAILYDIPVFSTKCGDSEIIIKNDNYLVGLKDFKSMSKKIMNHLNLSFEEKDILSATNKKNIIDKYSMSIIFNEYMSLYKNTLLCVE
jgi:glycosyltransferase involved in cell wall biosynthesis